MVKFNGSKSRNILHGHVNLMHTGHMVHADFSIRFQALSCGNKVVAKYFNVEGLSITLSVPR